MKITMLVYNCSACNQTHDITFESIEHSEYSFAGPCTNTGTMVYIVKPKPAEFFDSGTKEEFLPDV